MVLCQLAELGIQSHRSRLSKRPQEANGPGSWVRFIHVVYCVKQKRKERYTMMSGSRSLPSTRLKTDVGPWVTDLRLRLPPGQRQRFQGRQDSLWTTAWTRCRAGKAPVVCSPRGTRSSEARAATPSWPASLFRFCENAGRMVARHTDSAKRARRTSNVFVKSLPYVPLASWVRGRIPQIYLHDMA